MIDATRFQFTDGAVPKAYNEYLVPRVFEPWAHRLLDEVELGSGDIVLDIATGPGTVARVAASSLARSSAYPKCPPFAWSTSLSTRLAHS